MTHKVNIMKITKSQLKRLIKEELENGSLPSGWSRGQYSMSSATDGELTVDVEDGMVTVEWEESSDDHYGRSTRSASFPLSVITTLMNVQPSSDEAWRRYHNRDGPLD